jgi:hypothetical protein
VTVTVAIWQRHIVRSGSGPLQFGGVQTLKRLASFFKVQVCPNPGPPPTGQFGCVHNSRCVQNVAGAARPLVGPRGHSQLASLLDQAAPHQGASCELASTLGSQNPPQPAGRPPKSLAPTGE